MLPQQFLLGIDFAEKSQNHGHVLRNQVRCVSFGKRVLAFLRSTFLKETNPWLFYATQTLTDTFFFQTIVVYSNYLSGLSDELFKCPLEFRPERWLNEDLGRAHPFATLPFGVGPRMCIGEKYSCYERHGEFVVVNVSPKN